MDFYGGGKVLLEGYTTRAGYKRDADIQIDAAERNYSFTYDGLDRNRYAQENKEIIADARNLQQQREEEEKRRVVAEMAAQGYHVDTGTGEITRIENKPGQVLPDSAFPDFSSH